MKKTILKTAIITIVSLVAAAVVTFSLIVIISPKTMGKIYYDLGSKNNAVRLYERQYNTKGKTFEDLKDFIDLVISVENEVKINEYGADLVVGNKSELKRLSDKESDENGRSLYDYYSIRIVEAARVLGLNKNAVEVAFRTSDEYTENCSLYHIVRIASDGDDKTFAVSVYWGYVKYGEAIEKGADELNEDIQKIVDKFDIRADDSVTTKTND